MTRRFFGNLLGVHQPNSGIFTLGELGPSTTGALTRPQLRWGGILGRSTLLGGGSGGALFLTLNQIMRAGTNSDVSSGTVAVVKGAGNVTSGTERWQTYNLLNTGSFTLADEAEVTFEVWGAAGGSGTSGGYAGLGGGGEYRKATFTLAPGTYYYVCGAGGGCGDSANDRSGSGGFGGGGVGGAYDTNNTGPSATAFGVGGYNNVGNVRVALGGGGGGLTGIFTSTTPSQSSALIVAGGGGGYGHSNGAGLPGGDTTSKSGTASSGGVAPANAEDGSAGKGGSGEGRGGGGGGGYWGGAGGEDGIGSPGGGGGRGYTDGAGFNTTTTAGSGNTPGGTSSANYVSGYGASNGSSHTSGGGGLIAISAVEVAGRFTTTGLIKLSELQQIRLGPSSASTVFPVFSSGSTASFPEGGTGAVYTAVAADSDNNAITFGLGSSKDEALFSINASGQVFFLTTPDFESPADGNTDNVYDIDIIATNGVNATTQAVTITVSDQNDPPVITSASTASFQENGTGTAYTITATDPNGDGVTFALGSSNDEALFNIVNNLVAFNTPPDFESPSDANADNAYIIEVIVTDSVGNSASQLVTISVTDDPTDITAPVISGSSSISAQENTTTTSTTLETFTATGGGTLSWSLTGTDATNFSINNSGELTFSSSPDFENPADANTDNSYDVTINVSNQAGSDTLAVAVSVTDDTADNPTAPQVSGPSTATFQENGTGAVATYTIQAGTTPITFSLSGTDAARFSISSSGVVTFNSSPDYESPTDSGGNNVYNLTVTASNAGGSTSTPLTVTVTDDPIDEAVYYDWGHNVSNLDNSRYFPAALTGFNNAIYSIAQSYTASDGYNHVTLVKADPTTGNWTIYNTINNAYLEANKLVPLGSYLYGFAYNQNNQTRYAMRINATGGGQSFSATTSSTSTDYVNNPPTGYAFNDARVPEAGSTTEAWGYDDGTRRWIKYNAGTGAYANAYVLMTSYPSVFASDAWKLPAGLGINVGDYVVFVSDGRNRQNLNVYHRPTATNLSNGSAFTYYGKISLGSWPFSTYSNYEIKGIAEVGGHIYLSTRDNNGTNRVARYEAPSSSNILATLQLAE